MSNMPQCKENDFNDILEWSNMNTYYAHNIPLEINELQNLEKLKIEFKEKKVLNLVNETLVNLPESIGCLNKLKELHISGWRDTYTTRSLTEIPESICNLKNLEKLTISHTYITTLPKSIGKLKNLKELRLNYNGITEIPSSIGDLNQLETLILNSNKKLTSLPHEITQLTSLKTLDVSFTNLNTLPKNLGNLILLENLRLHFTELVEIPESIEYLQNLRELEIHQKTRIPNSITKLKLLSESSIDNLNTSINYHKREEEIWQEIIKNPTKKALKKYIEYNDYAYPKSHIELRVNEVKKILSQKSIFSKLRKIVAYCTWRQK